MIILPPNPGFDARYCALPHAIVRRDVLLHARIKSNGADLIERQLAAPAAFAAVRRAVNDFVGMIVDACIPAKIIQNVVRRVAVVVTAFHAVRARASKGKQYQSVDLRAFLLVIPPQLHMSAPIANGDDFHRPSAHISDATKIRNVVVALEPGDLFPVFHARIMPGILR